MGAAGGGAVEGELEQVVVEEPEAADDPCAARAPCVADLSLPEDPNWMDPDPEPPEDPNWTDPDPEPPEAEEPEGRGQGRVLL